MTGPRRPRGRRTGRTRAAQPTALTTDSWYTLIYLTDAERRRLAARRRKLWMQPLREAGLDRPLALRLLRRTSRWCARVEAKGRTPTVREQLHRLERWARRRLEADQLPAALDEALLRADVRPAPGALVALRSLDDQGIPVAVVSNVLNESGSAARAVLDRLGLLRWCRAVVLSCEHPWAKPDPRPFRLACRFLHVEPSAAVHVGDLAYDVIGAGSAGLSAWWYVGLRRYNGYLTPQVDPRSVTVGATVWSWKEVPRRLGDAPADRVRPSSRSWKELDAVRRRRASFCDGRWSEPPTDGRSSLA